MADPVVAVASNVALLPTRRWRREELEHDRREAQRRLATGDVSGWRETIGRAMTNRPDDMVRRHGGDERKAVRAMCRFHLEWTDRMLRDLETRPETLATEVQAIRVGDLYCVANASEFFTPFALDVRRRAGVPELMLACYANGRIGYLPDEHDIAAKSYAGYQSPKYCDQFPFTPASGPRMCDAMLRVVGRCRDVVPAS
jgi:neutral ceramidase